MDSHFCKGDGSLEKFIALTSLTTKKGLYKEAHLIRYFYLSCQSILKITPPF